MAVFDVLREPWIPALRPDGSAVTLGILDFLEQAHELKALASESPLENYAVFRLLCAFLMDAYTPKHIEDRQQILANGHFDPDVLRNYIDLCLKEGVSFNLFDENRPFMQSRKDPKVDKDTVPVAVLVHALPSGNNHIHFDHRLSGEHRLTAAEALRTLCAAYVFSVGKGRGYYPYVNGRHCTYVVYEGQTLFEALTVGIISKGECEKNIPWDDPPVAWRNFDEPIPEKKEESNKKASPVSLLAAFTWQPLRVTLMPTSEGEKLYIREIYRQSSQKSAKEAVWVDPHVPYEYKKVKNEWFPIKPHQERETWRDIGPVTAADTDKANTRQPLILANYKRLLRKRTSGLLNVHLTALVTDQAKYLSIQDDSLALPAPFFEEPALGRLLRNDLNDIETMASDISSSYNKPTEKKHSQSNNKKQNKRLSSEIVTELQSQFFSTMYEKLFSEYFPYVAKIDRNQDNWGGLAGEYLDNILKKMRDLVMHQGAQRFASNARALRDMAAAEADFVRDCGSLLKKRRENR